MRTTLNLDDEVMKAVKRAAVDRGVTMTEVVEEALRDAVMRGPRPAERRFELRLPVVRGRMLPGVDVTDRDSLFDAMEERR